MSPRMTFQSWGNSSSFVGAEEAADFRDPRGIPGVEGSLLAARTDGHRPEFEQEELDAFKSHPRLTEKPRARASSGVRPERWQQAPVEGRAGRAGQ